MSASRKWSWGRLAPMLMVLGGGSLLGAGCASEYQPGDDLDIPSFENYVGGKSDTGYIGSRAAELESTFSGKVRVILPGKTRPELEALAAALMASPDSWEHRDITSQVTEQIKYSRNALKAAKLDLNLEGGTPAFTKIDIIDSGLELSYAVKVESLIKFKELEAAGKRPQDFVGQTIEAKLPLVPGGLFERVGAACATDPDTHQPVPAADVGAHNMFFYFDPAREGCPLSADFVTTGKMVIESSLDAPIAYPEYDRLVADGKIEMGVIFGQIEHGDLSPSDWGFRSFNTLTRSFQRLGFAISETYPGNKGHALKKVYPGGLTVTVKMLTPVSFADHVPREQSNLEFQKVIRESEIVYYNGHAFYGSLTVLDDKANYPADKYQIMFMDACWSYAYYTKQIFRNRATDADPKGYAMVDVVNNTEPGITGSEETAAILYDNIFKGAAAVKAGTSAAAYSWNNMIKYMNDHAEARARARAGTDHENPEIYGASGVRDNKWKPGSGGGTGPVTPPAGATRFEVKRGASIPDASTTGVSQDLSVPTTSKKADSVKIEVDIEHSYIGDLTVTLTHAGKTVTLHQQAGGGADDLSLRLTSDAWKGLTAQGRWTLKVVDSEAQDVGTLQSWAIVL